MSPMERAVFAEQEIIRLKEQNRELVEALSEIIGLEDCAIYPDWKADWHSAIRVARAALANAEGQS